MAYRVTLRPAAARELGKVRGPQHIALNGAIQALGNEPRHRGATKLTGTQQTWRVRVTLDGVRWRIVYLIDDQQRWIRVLRVARRDESTYRGI